MPIAIFLLLLAAPFTWPAAASAPLVADAGDSTIAYDGAPIALAASAAGGVGPYTFAWSWSGDPARLSGSTFSTAGLAPQDIILTLTVTDANGDLATDTVRDRADVSFHLDRTVSVTAGIPDEEAGAGGLGVDSKTVFFSLPSGIAHVDATLAWNDSTGQDDLDLRLLDPAGNDATGAQGASSADPERARVDGPAAGRWTARVEPFASGPVTARLTIDGFAAASIPTPALASRATFGRTDAQALAVSATGGTGPYSFAWDLDHDGAFETSGASATTSFPVGVHDVRARVADALGFRASISIPVDVRDADTILHLICGGDPTTPYWAMEYTSTNDTCWMHGGHHTYFVGDQRFAFRALDGFVFTVEQQFSPTPEQQPSAPGFTPLHIEVSDDGRTWTEVAHGDFHVASTDERQRVDITGIGAGQPFRFVRLHEPLSAAQGLSGYLDHSQFDVEADRLPLAAPALTPGTRALSCTTDLMESFFAAHPCTFGGVDRYDAPSFWHTYEIGDGGVLDHVSGTYQLAPWRSDDWNDGNTTTNATGISARVEVSVDGVHWDDVARVQGAYGAPESFDITLPHTPARFVRLFPEYQARFDQTVDFAPDHHPKGYFVSSSLVVSGLLPSAS